ncbi:hypothetical protein J3L16_04070 [Alteromonas sp. 5E99-2]|uniref:hypothetical protein n=1 Tax=Alteromonas sp. 5E99-2 TaxID=2817683 RepID=UPI001A990035|nr:hypothetical protein [Alteromonas sp. 5E99-2]MBO1254865.1 hypothetical protein [Alteromonas sp. 5E99-2]
MNKIISTALTLIFTTTVATASTQTDLTFNNDVLKRLTSESLINTLEEIDTLNQLSISEQSEITFNSEAKKKRSIRIANSKFFDEKTITLGE